MIHKALIALGMAAALAAYSNSAFAADAAEGEKIFKKKCGACHDLEKNKTGPHLGGVVGRKAGESDFTRYKGLEGADFIWTEPLIVEYMQDPTAFVQKHTSNKSSSMTFKLKDQADAEAVAAYLATTKAAK